MPSSFSFSISPVSSDIARIGVVGEGGSASFRKISPLDMLHFTTMVVKLLNAKQQNDAIVSVVATPPAPGREEFFFIFSVNHVSPPLPDLFYLTSDHIFMQYHDFKLPLSQNWERSKIMELSFGAFNFSMENEFCGG
ncbi:hypothetical protein C2S52_006441 [Perilla frutescens var. hirtella]|nr:hypothetical protein C2S51_009361 [Perilla frutescens var. frutescens]KAH6786889.1 hypothetical protein C2S52_006441 [Perilla frutescens var. hirtella]